MKMHKYYSPLGVMNLIADKGFLVYCNWDTADCIPKMQKAISMADSTASDEDRDVIVETCRQLDEYFATGTLEFNVPIKLNGTEFQLKVWEKLREIPLGETITYKELALGINAPKSLRAVASACGANPIALIVPCHRVVGSNGKSGGYTGGQDKKLKLLSLEIRKIFGEMEKLS